jgi:hypothetical protein
VALSSQNPGFRVSTPLEKFCTRLILQVMQDTLTFLPLGSSETESNPAFNVLIAYEDFETGKHAKKTYDFLVENLGRECHLTNQMWKFDVLSIPKLREIAVRDATMADIIIISSYGRELPQHISNWIESWLLQGTGALALVALFEDSQTASRKSLSTVKEYLAGVAKRGSMEFFAQPDEWPGSSHVDRPFPFDRSRRVSDRTLSTLAGVVHRDIVTPRWGLNE